MPPGDDAARCQKCAMVRRVCMPCISTNSTYLSSTCNLDPTRYFCFGELGGDREP